MYIYICFYPLLFWPILIDLATQISLGVYFFVNGGGTREVMGASFPSLKLDLSIFPLLKDK